MVYDPPVVIRSSVKMDDIPKFEKQNDVSINIFGYEENEIFPVHITNHRFERHINLLNGKSAKFRNKSVLVGQNMYMYMYFVNDSTR
jgi:hypothetical protein